MKDLTLEPLSAENQKLFTEDVLAESPVNCLVDFVQGSIEEQVDIGQAYIKGNPTVWAEVMGGNNKALELDQDGNGFAFAYCYLEKEFAELYRQIKSELDKLPDEDLNYEHVWPIAEKWLAEQLKLIHNNPTLQMLDKILDKCAFVSRTGAVWVVPLYENNTPALDPVLIIDNLMKSLPITILKVNPKTKERSLFAQMPSFQKMDGNKSVNQYNEKTWQWIIETVYSAI